MLTAELTLSNIEIVEKGRDLIKILTSGPGGTFMRFIIYRMPGGGFDVYEAAELRKGNSSWSLLPGAGFGLTLGGVMEFIGLKFELLES
jgi:hypothetical protein